MPWLYAPGNHDIDPGASSDATALAAFHRVYGADTRAWQTPLANFVVLDVITLPGQKPAYIGASAKTEYALQRYLPTLDKDKPLVLAMHIPLFDEVDKKNFRVTDRARLFALLALFPQSLVLSAHSHNQRQCLSHGGGWLVGCKPAA